jgi:predicted anti-sigma-YlaC factor YlaD
VAREEVEAHLAICELCRPHFLFADEMRRGLASTATPELMNADESNLRDRVRDALARLARRDSTDPG